MCDELNSEIEALKEELFKYKPSKGKNGRFIKKKKS
jgi:ribosomal protein L29